MAKKFWSFLAKDVMYRACFMKPVISKNREIACISKTTDHRDLRPCLNDSAGPILGGLPQKHFSPTSTVFALIARNDLARNWESSGKQATVREYVSLFIEFVSGN